TAVDHHDLAVIAQVGPAAKWDVQHRHEVGNAGAGPQEWRQETPPNPPRADVVEEQADLDPLAGLLGQALQELLTHRAPAEDVRRDVDRRPGFPDQLLEMSERVFTPGEQLDPIAAPGGGRAV